MVTIDFRSCPKCTGDMHFETYHGDIYWTCIQCGYERSINHCQVDAHLISGTYIRLDNGDILCSAHAAAKGID